MTCLIRKSWKIMSRATQHNFLLNIYQTKGRRISFPISGNCSPRPIHKRKATTIVTKNASTQIKRPSIACTRNTQHFLARIKQKGLPLRANTITKKAMIIEKALGIPLLPRGIKENSTIPHMSPRTMAIVLLVTSARPRQKALPTTKGHETILKRERVRANLVL